MTTSTTIAEVQEYLSHLARKKRLPLDTVLLAAVSLPVTVVERTVYAAKIAEATRRLGRRDPDDVELLALALHSGVPIWSNDKDFEDAGVDWFTTAELLKEARSLRPWQKCLSSQDRVCWSRLVSQGHPRFESYLRSQPPEFPTAMTPSEEPATSPGTIRNTNRRRSARRPSQAAWFRR